MGAQSIGRLVLLVLAVLMAANVSAQTLTSGSVAGVVRDSTAAVYPASPLKRPAPR